MISQVSATSAYPKNSPSFGMSVNFTKKAAKTLREQFDNPTNLAVVTRHIKSIGKLSDEKGFDVLLSPSKKDSRALLASFKLHKPHADYLVNPSSTRVPLDDFCDHCSQDSVASSMANHVAGSIRNQTEKFQSLVNYDKAAQIEPGRIAKFFGRFFGK